MLRLQRQRFEDQQVQSALKQIGYGWSKYFPSGEFAHSIGAFIDRKWRVDFSRHDDEEFLQDLNANAACALFPKPFQERGGRCLLGFRRGIECIHEDVSVYELAQRSFSAHGAPHAST